MLKAEYTLAPGEPFNTDLGQYGPDQQVVFKTTMQLILSLQTGAWTNALTAHYKSGYKDAGYGAGKAIFLANPDGSLGDSVAFCCLHVPSYTTWDWQTVYNFSKDIRATIGIHEHVRSRAAAFVAKRRRWKPDRIRRALCRPDRSCDLRANGRQVLISIVKS